MKVYNQKIVDSAWVYTVYRIILWLSIILKLLLYTSFHEGGAWGGVYIARSLMFFGVFRYRYIIHIFRGNREI